MTAASTKATPKRKAIFLEVLAWCGNVSEAARSAGIDRKTAYNWKEKDADFALAWGEAIEVACDILEMEARRRAIEGTEEPVFYKGKLIAKVRKKSDMLMMFLLNGYRPEKFKRRHEHEHSGPGGEPIRAAVVQYPVNPRDGERDDGNDS